MSDIEERVTVLAIVVWVLSAIVIAAIIVFSSWVRSHNGVRREQHIEMMNVQDIAKAPYDTISYACTSGVSADDFRKKCGENYHCDIFFHGNGECALVLP
jgi:hypothetical protein